MASIRTLLLALIRVRPLVGQVREQRNLCSRGARTGRDIAGGQAANRGRRRTHARSTTNRAGAVAPAKTKLGTDVSSEAASSGYHAGFNFHFLSLTVELSQQPVDGWHHRGNVLDDKSIGPVVRDYVSALSKETLDCGYNVLGMCVAQEAGNRDFVHGQSLGFHLGAP